MAGRVPAALRRAGSTVRGRRWLPARFSPRRSRLFILLGLLGPGLIAANAGNDAGGIATYSSVGAAPGTGAGSLGLNSMRSLLISRSAIDSGFSCGAVSTSGPTYSSRPSPSWL